MPNLYPGNVVAVLEAIPGDPSSDHAPATIVGASNQWGDSSDSSYAITESNVGGAFEDDPVPNAYFPATVVSDPPTTSLYVRCSSTTTYEDAGRTLSVELHDPADDDDIFRIDIDLVADSDIHDYTVDVFPQDWMNEDDLAYFGPLWISALAAGAWVIPYSINFEFGHPEWTSQVTIYELWLIIAGVGRLKILVDDLATASEDRWSFCNRGT